MFIIVNFEFGKKFNTLRHEQDTYRRNCTSFWQDQPQNRRCECISNIKINSQYQCEDVPCQMCMASWHNCRHTPMVNMEIYHLVEPAMSNYRNSNIRRISYKLLNSSLTYVGYWTYIYGGSHLKKQIMKIMYVIMSSVIKKNESRRYGQYFGNIISSLSVRSFFVFGMARRFYSENVWHCGIWQWTIPGLS